jgi:flagellar basal-body rod modification protein FlgD
MNITGTSILDTSSTSSTEASSGPSGAPTEQTFLQLLVAQLKNQDPMNPADGMQFVSELAQFSELEQVIAMRNDLDRLAGASPSGSV